MQYYKCHKCENQNHMCQILVANGLGTAGSLSNTLNRALSYSRQKKEIQVKIDFECLGFKPKKETKTEAIQHFQEAIESLQIEELEKTMKTLDELGISLYDSKNQYKPLNQVLQEIAEKISKEEN